MFKNEIDNNSLKTALKRWTTRTDGYDGAIGGVLAKIPYSDEMNSVMSWDYASEKLDDAIGSCETFDLDKIFNGNKSEIDRLENWANERAKGINLVYDGLISCMNDSNKHHGVIVKCMGVDNRGFAIYKEIARFSAFTKSEVVEKLLSRFASYGGQNWDLHKAHDSLDNGMSVCIGSTMNAPLGYFCHIEEK